jgi:hypothetical protein
VSGYNYADDFDREYGERENEGGSGLRKQLEEALEGIRLLRKELNEERRGSTLKSLFEAQGKDPAAMALVPEDADPREWFEKNGHLLASVQGPKDETKPTPEVVTEQPAVLDADLLAEQEAMAQMQQAPGSTGSTVTQQDPFAQLAALNSEAEMLAFLDQQKGGTKSQGLM